MTSYHDSLTRVLRATHLAIQRTKDMPRTTPEEREEHIATFQLAMVYAKAEIDAEREDD